MTITVNTSGFIDFRYSYYASGVPQAFWGLVADGSQVFITFNELGEVLTFTTIPAPAKPPTTSTAGTVNTSPPLYQILGTVIPIIWGSIRVNGSQMWSGPAYAGGGGNAVDVAVAWGTPLESSGPVGSTLTIKFWGNGNLFYDATAGGSSVGALSFTDYTGDENQLPDPNIQLYQGVPGTPAFRGLIYTAFKGLPLAPFNNSVASTTFSIELHALGLARTNLSYALKHLGQRAGFGLNDFTITGIDDAHDGGQIAASTDFVTLLQGFAAIYGFLILEHPLRLNRIAVGGSLTIDRAIAEADCISTSSTDDVVLVSDVEPWQLPNQVSLSYISAALNYQKATAVAKRPIFPFGLTGPLRTQTYDLPLVITDDEAANLAWLYLYRLWTQARTLSTTLLPKHLAVEPGDVITIPVKGVTYTAFVTRSTIKPDFSNAITASVLLTNTTIALTSDPGAVLPPVLVCPVTDWTTFDAASAVNAKVTNCGRTVTSLGAANGLGSASGGARSLSGRTAGKYVFQMTLTVGRLGDGIGIAEIGQDFATMMDDGSHPGAVIVLRNGLIFGNLAASGFSLPFGDAGDVYTFAVDLDAKLFWVKLNSGNWNGAVPADPASGAFGVSFSAFTGPMSPVAGLVAVGSSFTGNFGQSVFVDRFGAGVPVPAGFTPGWPI